MIDPSSRRRAGFTLIEVLFALVLFTLAAVVLGSAYVNVLNSYFVMNQAVVSDDDLKFARAEVLREPDRKKVEEGGQFQSTNGRAVRWTARIEETTLPDLFDVEFACEITVPGEANQPRREQRIRVLRPTWSEAADRDKLRSEVAERIQRITTELKR